MRRHLHGAVVAAAAVLALAITSTASATSWSSNGTAMGTSFTASINSGQTVTLTVRDSSSTVVGAILCGQSTVTGTLDGPTNPGVWWPNAMRIQPSFSLCRAGLLPGFSVVCEPVTFGYIAQTWSVGVTSGFLQSLDCRITFTPAGCGSGIDPGLRFLGNLDAMTYSNSGSFNAPVAGTYPTSGQYLNATWGGPCESVFGTADFGTVTIATSGTSPAAWSLGITSAFRPNISQP